MLDTFVDIDRSGDCYFSDVHVGSAPNDGRVSFMACLPAGHRREVASNFRQHQSSSALNVFQEGVVGSKLVASVDFLRRRRLQNDN